MRSVSFGNFQSGIVDNPEDESKGGFEFAAGVDIFSQPGVVKANFALAPVTGLSSIFTMPRSMETVYIAGVLTGFMAIDDKIYTSTDGIAWSVFLTNSVGRIDNLYIYNGYIFYTSSPSLGRCPVSTIVGQNDTWQTLSVAAWYPMVEQGGSLKIGHSRYVAVVDELSTFTAQAMKAPTNYAILSLEKHQNLLYVGTTLGTGFSTINTEDATTFVWDGVVLSSGSALPNSSYHLSKRGMNLLLTTGQGLFGFPDKKGEIFLFDGARFLPYRQLYALINSTDMVVTAATGCEHSDTLLFTGDVTNLPGVFQMKGSAICQAFVPSTVSPTAAETMQFGFVRSAFNGLVLISYFRPADNAFHVEYTTANRQNNAIVRTLWHRISHIRGVSPDRIKRWRGVKLNLKPIPSGCFVQVGYRTARDVTFTDSGYTLSAANQDRPIILSVSPRSRAIQFQIKLFTSTISTPELLSYDPLFELLNTIN